VLVNDDEVELADLLRDKRAVLGLSDAGAHASQLCDACFSTHLLQHWVRDEGAITLEQAVWRLTGHAAHVFRIADRGRITPGAWADLVAFDAATVAPGDLERVHDLPSGADRLIARSTGIEHVWVNGVATRLDGKDIDGAHPGVLIRGGTA
jgi:N-acyl-D-aspartate/D-glutamate deacylase